MFTLLVAGFAVIYLFEPLGYVQIGIRIGTCTDARRQQIMYSKHGHYVQGNVNYATESSM